VLTWLTLRGIPTPQRPLILNSWGVQRGHHSRIDQSPFRRKSRRDYIESLSEHHQSDPAAEEEAGINWFMSNILELYKFHNSLAPFLCCFGPSATGLAVHWCRRWKRPGSIFSLIQALMYVANVSHRPPPTCFRYSTIRYSSIQGSDKTTSGFGKRMAAILEFYFRFRYSHPSF